jgi:uncharacterized membrane protein YfcA
LCALSLMLAGVVKGISGIGVPLVGISLLSLLVPVPQAIALLPVPIVVVNAWQVLINGGFPGVCRRFASLLLAMCVGTVIGTALLASIDVLALLLAVGCVITVFALAELLRLRVRVPSNFHHLAGGAAGLLGGVLGGLSSIFGPPILMYLVTLQLSKDEFVRAICGIYLIAGIMLAITLAAFGVAGVQDLKWSALATVPLLIGVVIGQFARARVSETQFRRGLLIMLVIIGANMIRRGMS